MVNLLHLFINTDTDLTDNQKHIYSTIKNRIIVPDKAQVFFMMKGMGKVVSARYETMQLFPIPFIKKNDEGLKKKAVDTIRISQTF